MRGASLELRQCRDQVFGLLQLLYSYGWRARTTEWVSWIPRSWNKAADRLATLALDEPAVAHYWRGAPVVSPADTGLILASDAGVRLREGRVGRGWFALQPGTCDLLACEAVSARGGGSLDDVNLQELEALRCALLYAAAVALGVDWMTPELEGKPLREAVLGELRGLVADSLDASLEWVG